MLRFVAGLALLASSQVSASDFEHHRALGLLVSGGGEYRSAISPSAVTDNGPRANVDVGASLNFSERWAALLEGRVTFGGAAMGLSFFGGLRNSWGDQFKTFFDLTLSVHALPTFSIGPRVGFGVQYELSPVIGVFGLVAAQFGGGTSLRFGVEGMIGVQFRTYVLE
jgi:hypothetical protein